MQSNLPNELTYVLRHSEEWQYPHTERQVTKTSGIVCSVDFGFTLPHDINAYAFSKYADVYVKDHQLGANKLPIRQPMLAKQTAQDMKESIEINRTILSYIYESASMNPEKRQILANYVAQRGISSTDTLRDEIFVQICSQSMIPGNKRSIDSSVEAVWTLMATCLSCFPPSAGLAKYLLKYVSDNGPSGMDIVCQHKLLNCLQLQQQLSRPTGAQQQQPHVKAVKPVRIVRSYPPCLLELKAATQRAGMALTGVFPDGERLTGQVESWISAEQFASHLLKNRNVGDQTTFSGWTVALKDEFDTYECAGHDFLLDLISEIEVPPNFPCGTAYFLSTTDVLRSNISSSARQKWPNQPHNADRLRLMMLEVDELSDLYIQAVPTSPILPTPVTASPVPLLSPSARLPSTAAPLGPPPSSNVRPEDVYASRDELMSQTSALNKRREPANADQLSKSSALNSRYTAVVNGDASGPPSLPAGGASSSSQPSAGLPRPSLASDDVGGRTAWTQDPIEVQRSRSAVARQQPPFRGPNQSRLSYAAQPPSPPLAPARSVPVATRPQQQQQPPPAARRPNDVDVDTMIDDIFDMDEDYREGNALQQRIKGGGDERNPQPTPPLPYNISGVAQPAYGLPPTIGFMPQPSVDPNAAIQYQLLQQQLLLQQAKQQQTADLQAALQAQQLQNQLLGANLQAEKLKRELNQLQRENAAATTAAVVPPVGTAIPPPPPGFGAKKPAPPTQPKTTVVGGKQAPVAIAPSNVTAAAAAGAVKNGGKSVTFAGSDLIAASASPSPPAVNGIAAVMPPPPTLNAVEPAQPVSPPPLANKAKLTVNIDASARDIGSMRRPPKKIGQIRWPPVSPEEEVKPPRPQQDIGRIQIEELKEEEVPITPRQPPEEIQRRINDMIVAARNAEAIGETPPVKPKPPPKQPSKQATSILAETGNIDMKARQEQLQQQLKFPLLGGKEAGENQAVPPAAAPSPPPAASFTAPPPPPPPPSVTPAVDPQSPAVLIRPSRPVSDYEEATVPSNVDPGTFDVHSLDYKRTALHAQFTDPFYTYDRVQWILEIRKEVFSPAEKFDNPTIINMIFQQIVVDVLNEDCIRIGKSERQKLAAILDGNGVSARNIRAAHSINVKRSVINAARELPIYFCRLFTVFGGKRNPRLHMVGVSHSGIRLLTRHKDQFKDYIDVQHHIKFEDLADITVPKQSTVLIRTVSGQTHVFYTPRACQLCNMVDTYRQEYREMSGRAGKMPLKPADSLIVSTQNDYNYYDFDDTS